MRFEIDNDLRQLVSDEPLPKASSYVSVSQTKREEILLFLSYCLGAVPNQPDYTAQQRRLACENGP